MLLASMARIVAWRRPGWAVESAVGVDGARRALRERPFDVMVTTVEPRSSGGSAMLKAARLHHDRVLRIAYRTSAACDGQEVRMAHGIVSWPADISALLEALDEAIARANHRSDEATEPPSSLIRPPSA